jgi:hypothetical protein
MRLPSWMPGQEPVLGPANRPTRVPGMTGAKNLMFQKLSPVLCPLLSSTHPRPHEGASGSGSEVRAGSGACGRGLPNPGLGRLSRNGGCRRFPSRCGRQAQRVARKSGAHGIAAEHNRRPGTKTGRQRLELLYRNRAAATGADLRFVPDRQHAGSERQKPPHTWRRATGFLYKDRPLGARVLTASFSYASACGGDAARPNRGASR